MAHELLAMAEQLERTSFVRDTHRLDSEHVPLQNLAELAARLHADRERRHEYFDSALLGEAAWDMMLYLFAAAVEKRQVSITTACNASGVPYSTALRYIDVLVRQGLAIRSTSEKDNRVSYIAMTHDCRVIMAAYLSRTLRNSHAADQKAFHPARAVAHSPERKRAAG
ncbi:hypothetical protein [Aurantiacibacter luteus]|uniref:hypothetical protein n=1 Tax=Aurantiacibacter luteus TaxID=1581420 RepID=UPI000699665D|nr:hypothetical protein [Aurantiacibacter luteus]